MSNIENSKHKISGIDVSAYQENIDWQRVKQTGVQFVFIKATEGSTFVDKAFARNISQAHQAGLLCGAYHFFRPKSSIQGQVDNFVKTVRATNFVNVLPVLDLEVPSDWRDIPRNDRVTLVKQWLEMVTAALKTTPIIYLSSSFPADVLSQTETLAAYKLWVAHYTHLPAPQVPKPWSDWAFWQYSNQGAVNGITGHVDLNWFNGSLIELNQLMDQRSQTSG